MPIKVTCPKCQGVLHAPDDAGGKRGKCPTCGTVLAIPVDSPKVPVPPQPAPAVPAAAATAAAPAPAAREEAEVEASRPPFASPARPPVEPASRPTPGRVPPPPAFPPPEQKKLSDPFVRSGKKPTPIVPGEGLARAWRKTRRGLGWIRAALWVALVAPLGLAGIVAAESFGTRLPTQDPGYLAIQGLSSAQEIRLAVGLIPVALGLLLLTFGRFGVSNAPRSSFAKGLATAAAVATLLVLLGVAAAAAPTIGQIASGFVPHDLLPADDVNGIVQRLGLAVAVIAGILAELWFVVAMGRMGASLQSPRLAARGTRFLILAGLVLAVVALWQFGLAVYPREVNGWARDYFWKYWNQLGQYKPAAEAGLAALGALVIWFWYIRLVGAGRRAIREWLEQNEPAT